jgi:DNA-binding protein Fis
MEKIYENSFPASAEESQDSDIKKLIEERIESVKNYMSGFPEMKGFSLYDIIISDVEKAMISSVLRETKGNQFKASKILGINRNTLRKKIKDLKI